MFVMAVARLGEALKADDWSEREKRRMQWQPITVAVETLDEGTRTSPHTRYRARGTQYVS
jgi:hypothetical protein